MQKQLLMLRNCTLTSAEPHTMFKDTVDMDQCHPSISKQVVVLRALKPRAGMAEDENIAQVTQ
jgi:hypothetical protein